MCGRFILMSPGRDLAERFRLEDEPKLDPRYNIAPTQTVAVIRQDKETLTRRLTLVRWGLIPSWAKDPSIGPRLINARAETAAEKPAFRAAFSHRRCLVPADGFYEWTRGKTGKQPFLVTLSDRSTFAFAGLWERWQTPAGEFTETCTLLTTDANELLRPIHDRMPVILRSEDYDTWLDTSLKNPDALKHLLRPYLSTEMTIRAVNPKVNKAEYDAADCIADYSPFLRE